MNVYDHKDIESKWQKHWEAEGVYKTEEKVGGNKFYILDMFPYPSGEGLHVGHPKGYIATDIVSRMRRMQGFSVLHPMGFDAFGLPAENYAIKTKTNPQISVAQNVARYKKQLEILGFDYDWSREVNTTDPEFYRWTQWIFLQLFKKGLAYESHEPINWCPSCKTGLANEDVEDGKCERCGTLVEKKPLRQWVLRITDYAERLLQDLEKEDLDWPRSIIELQKNWIGRSEGALVKFPVVGTEEAITVFTTRIDTIYSGTFIVLSPEHPFIEAHKASVENFSQVAEYLSSVKNKTDLERTDKNNKTGVELKGIKVINPATGDKLPVWVSDFVLGGYGTGAVFADAHDKRDFDMAKAYQIPLKVSLKPVDGDFSLIEKLETCFEGEGILVNSGEFDGLTSAEARPKIIAHLEKKAFAQKKVQYKLRDWVFSRQRYWGEPMPLIHCPKCGVVPVPEKDLPVTLPAVEHYEPTGTGESPLAAIESWVNVSCPQCGTMGKRETNTMPQWAGSSWYYLRYMDPKNAESLVSVDREKFWAPVDFYVGGAEHATRHLIYARFWHKFLYDIGVVSTKEPFKKLQHVGLIMAEDGRKMSKRYGNVVNPDEIVALYGADTLRLYEMFMGPFDQSIAWSTKNMIGSRRFIERVWKLQEKIVGEESKKVTSLLQQTIEKVTKDIQEMRFNTAISCMMIFLNEAEEVGITKATYERLLKLLAPFAPHITEELWQHIGNTGSIHQSVWPSFNPELIVQEEMTIVVQVNGKVRGELKVNPSAQQTEIEEMAQKMPEIQKWSDGRKTKKVIFVKGKLVNIVLE